MSTAFLQIDFGRFPPTFLQPSMIYKEKIPYRHVQKRMKNTFSPRLQKQKPFGLKDYHRG